MWEPKERQDLTPIQKLKKGETFLSLQVMCDLSMTSQMTLSDSGGNEENERVHEAFLWPLRDVESAQYVETRIQSTRVQQQRDN